jgi:hypothetical protein
LPSFPILSSDILANLYLMASDQYPTFLMASMADTMQLSMICSPSYLSSNSLYPTFAASKKKYKPVALKVHPVITDLPDHFRIVHNIMGDPLENMPKLNIHLDIALYSRVQRHHRQKPPQRLSLA